MIRMVFTDPSITQDLCFDIVLPENLFNFLVDVRVINNKVIYCLNHFKTYFIQIFSQVYPSNFHTHHYEQGQHAEYS